MGPPRAHGPTEALLGPHGALKFVPSSRETPQGLPGTCDLLCSPTGECTFPSVESPYMGRLPIDEKTSMRIGSAHRTHA